MNNTFKRLLSIFLMIVLLANCSVLAFAAESASVAVNTATQQTYDDVAQALLSASSGDTVALTSDAVATIVCVPNNVVLDLNGYALEASYMSCFGDIVDNSNAGTGLLNVPKESFLIQKNNASLPVKTPEGYRFLDVTKFNTAYLKETSKFAFQPFIEASGHALLTSDLAATGVTITLRVSWAQENGVHSQNFVYYNNYVTKYLNSYNKTGDTERYGQMFTLTLANTDGFEQLTFEAVVKSDTGVEFVSAPVIAGQDGEYEEPSVDKFLPKESVTELIAGRSYPLDALFSAVDGANICSDTVTVTLTDNTPDNSDTVTMVYTANADDWTKSTVTFTGSDCVNISICDGDLCNIAVLSNVKIVTTNVLITNEEFIYGSYFDHDRFEGNTGTRLTSGAYNLIRSADALLPAQDITVQVTDTNLSNYKVTLGYYTKDGIYTGRTGILAMTDGVLTIKASAMTGGYFRVNVYIYNGQFTKVPESAVIEVYGGEHAKEPVLPDDPDTPESDLEGMKISILGDSISTGGYPGILSNLTGATIQNLAVSGTLLTGGLTNQVANVASDADLVIVFGGTNDYWHKNVQIGETGSTDAGTYTGALYYILNYLKTNYANADYLFVFPPDQTFGGYPSSTDFGKGSLDDFRAAFLNFCQANDVPYLDLKETEFVAATHTGDGVHPNSVGHQIIAEAIYEAITQTD